MLFVIAGSLLASLSLSYAWWTKVRVMGLRQHIFDERDALFDLAVKLGGCDDPGYRAARRHLNSIANSVDAITFDLLFYVAAEGFADGLPPPPVCADPALQAAVESAIQRCGVRIVRSLFRGTFLGRLILFRAWIRGIAMANERLITRLCNEWLWSHNPEFLDRTAAA